MSMIVRNIVLLGATLAFAFWFLCIACGPLTAAERFALVIGNSDYVVGTPLRNPVNDATDLAGALQTLGFRVDLHKDLDKEGLENAVDASCRKLPPNSVAFFFFAGHGLQIDGRNFLVQIDAQPGSPAIPHAIAS